ncbi:hypothetical protein CSW98_01050 [Vibrio sp. HA2012]|uniref:hypothetical protein n=1 Tax=Vibrio sp. HA2012 TaxID=1971595 RepID=UPI000C2CD884|nr:hypothetical protein [Vibrio sp. HA2012]PJC87746.1 hypothetical protein CSW98_01050 [Vibrio sp. HA2012]
MKYLILSILAALLAIPAIAEDSQTASGQGADFSMAIDCGDFSSGETFNPEDPAMDQVTLSTEITHQIISLCPGVAEVISSTDSQTAQLVGATFKDTAEDIAADIARKVAVQYDFTTEFDDRSCQVLRINPGSQSKIMCDTNESNPSAYCAELSQETISEIMALCDSLTSN